ncbi:MAG TPA: aldehyde dehydrogenase family protein [Candidatus Obscuribacter sp.]|nr:aldehyde dehydrogenase family protein [Candidatus Obscuribacter sp.]HND06729.1 aldehyde dehydrogenase family protein [Candidatus Obscuribacter sp.]HNG20532.1 aldehyde dehydrogenase family protein [Candidatus Obscuribacter sp.]HNH74013.1 aldehyde dehydrogenase family protein [Candidatus Obscuribacter sp.]
MAQTLTAPKVKVDRKWQLFIDGKFVDGASERTLVNPADGKPLTKVAEAGPKQVEEAIKAARTAFDKGPWPRMAALERANMLFKIADIIDKNAEELAELETLNGGKPLREAQYDIADTANCFRYYAGLITKPTGTTVDVPAPSVTSIVREPIGVCGQIVPWNYPLLMAAWKLAPALAAGNTCVLKPSEYTPLTAIRLAELLKEVDLPDGVVNIVLGDGPKVGQPIAESKLVDKIAFTGSVKTGKIIAQAALSNLKKVTLELGGKSPMIVFSDFDLDTAVDYALFAIYCNSGQVCSAGSRMIVEESIYDDFVAKMAERAKKIRVGPGLEEDTEMGPLVSEPQMKRVLEYIEIGKKEGAKLITGGERLKGDKYGNGFYISPTIFSNVKPSMRIVQEEIFGPVVVVQKFKSEEEAVELANDSDYGLAGAVFTKDITRAHKVVKQLKAGITWVNAYHNTYTECPWGGYKQSGWGRELGTFGLEAYTEIKQVNINLDPIPVGWFENQE